MAIDLKIPEVGESITEVQIGQWLKAEGNQVTKDDPIAVIDSEKATFELPCPETGVLTRILRQAGDVVRVGEVIAQIEPGTDPKATAGTAQMEPELNPEPAPAARPGPPKPPEPGESTQSEASEKREPIPPGPRMDAPAAKKPKSTPPDGGEAVQEKQARLEKGEMRAEERRSEPSPKPRFTEAAKPAVRERKDGAVPGSPPEKRVRNGDASDREEEVVPMTMLRRTVARRLVEAQKGMASLTTFNEIDMTTVQSLRRQHQEAFHKRYGVKLGFMSFFVKAVIDALKQFPQLNAEVRGTDVVYHNFFDIGVAISSERGLVVPVLRNAERLSFAETEAAIAEYARRAGEGALKPAELEGGTFTITNGGVFGSLLSTPIINPPQAGILGMHAIADRPVAVEGNVVIRPMMYVALTYDHRIVDGREAVLFLRRVRETIEIPARMLLEV